MGGEHFIHQNSRPCACPRRHPIRSGFHETNVLFSCEARHKGPASPYPAPCPYRWGASISYIKIHSRCTPTHIRLTSAENPQNQTNGGLSFSAPTAPSARNAACCAFVSPLVLLMSSRS